MINTKHLDTDLTSAALREVDGASKATGEKQLKRGGRERSEGKQSGTGIRKVGTENWSWR